ncbi:MAG TPA: carbohydrate ABC transporter permease [Bacilli bacterium]|nr:carbohydrate ABC transporter permease [Acholeplasmataceae bacterium]OQB65118.1 MAG: L-arabinose transport system permease protein AraQ [Tenericutes bacterium ADurb.Bin140]HOE77184.1 carbohydrate ABC transporter permease [Bacilli bacterium]HON63300.1 carbohydrate ABC transporter permease [Bacilli bacterium]HOR95382.1 carbohydrate ABC transporter permease [Bacilli bacterium]
MKLRNKTDGILNFSDYKKWYFKLFYAVLILVLLFIVFISVVPPLWVLISGFKDPSELFSPKFSFFPEHFRLSKIFDSWERLNVGKYYLNSIIVVAGSVVSAVLFNGLMAYVISVLKPAGHKIIYALLLMTMMIPAVTNMRTLLGNIAKLGLMQKYLPLWLSYGANVFYIVMFKTYFDSIPKPLIEAARLDGASNWQIFTRIVFPLSLPIVMVVSIFAINASWSDFLLPYLVLNSVPDKQTLMVRIYSVNMNPPSGMTQDQILMLIGLSIIPVLILFGIFQRQITDSVATTGIKE